MNFPYVYIFDLDGVLVDSEYLIEKALKEWALSVNFNPEMVYESSNSRRDYDLVKEIAPHLCPVEQSEKISRIECRLSYLLEEIKGAKAYYSSIPQDFKCIVTSSTRLSALSRLKELGLPPPKVLITADDVINGKPDPEPYQLALNKMGCSKEECIVFEDSDTGAFAAKQAGIRCIGVGTELENNSLTYGWIKDFTCSKKIKKILMGIH